MAGLITNADKAGFFALVSKMRELQKSAAKARWDKQLTKDCAECEKQVDIAIKKIAERMRPVQREVILLSKGEG